MTNTVYVLRYAAKMAQAELHALINVGLLFNDAADEIERLRKTLREIEDSSNDPRAVREARVALEGKP